MKKLMTILMVMLSLTMAGQVVTTNNVSFDKLKLALAETERETAVILTNYANIIAGKFEYNLKTSPLNVTSLDAKTYLGTENLKAIYISTSGRSAFPTVSNSIMVKGAPFKTNTIFRLILTRSSDGTINHFFLIW